MIKDRYPLKMLPAAARSLFDTISETFERYGKTRDTELQLPLAVIQPFHKRLSGALLYPTGKVKVSLRKTEALAFHNLYMHGILRSSIITAEINTEIHKTL